MKRAGTSLVLMFSIVGSTAVWPSLAEGKQLPAKYKVIKIYVTKSFKPSYGSWEGGTYLPSERGNPLSNPKKFWDYNDRWQSGGGSGQ